MIDWKAILLRYGKRPLFVIGQDVVRYDQFYKMVESAGHPEQTDPLVLPGLQWGPDGLAKFMGALHVGKSVLLAVAASLYRLEEFPGNGPFLILRSGGTTAGPRHIVHRFSRFLGGYRVKDRDECRMMILYAADHVAGIDSFLQALHRGATMVLPEDWTAEAIGSAIQAGRVDTISATPSMLKFLLLAGLSETTDLSSVATIAHGAEEMPLSLKKRLTDVFPNARFRNRYGMTELGALPVRSDPAEPDAFFLEQDGYAWKIENGELFIKSPARFVGTLEDGPACSSDPWYPTGDHAEYTESGSVRILGRQDSMINVGGTKVFASQVENLLLSSDAVVDATVFPAHNDITGESVAAWVVFKGVPDEAGLLREMRKKVLHAGLPLAYAPTRILPVNELKITRSWKKQRFPDCHNDQPV